MTKEELKVYISNIGLDEDIEMLLYELIDSANEVNDILLNAVADVLDMQADFYQRTADVLMDEVNEYGALQEQLDAIENEELKEQLDTIADNQEEFIKDLDQKIEEFRKEHPEARAEAGDIAKAEEELKEVVEDSNANDTQNFAGSSAETESKAEENPQKVTNPQNWQ